MLTRRKVIADTLAPPAGLAQQPAARVTRRGYTMGIGRDPEHFTTPPPHHTP